MDFAAKKRLNPRDPHDRFKNKEARGKAREDIDRCENVILRLGHHPGDLRRALEPVRKWIDDLEAAEDREDVADVSVGQCPLCGSTLRPRRDVDPVPLAGPTAGGSICTGCYTNFDV